MPPRRFAFGRTEDAYHPDTIRAALAEFFATAIFVFAAEGSVLSLGNMHSITLFIHASTLCMHACLNLAHVVAADKLTRETSTAGGLILVAIAHALALFVAVSVAFNISGGHVNPAVTFGALVGGRISVIRAVFYWIAQLLGAIVASILLRICTGGMVSKASYKNQACMHACL